MWPTKNCAEIKIIWDPPWSTIILRIFASNVPASPVTLIFDPSLLEVFLSPAMNSSNYPFWACLRLRWSSAENSFNLKFFWSMQILQNRYDFRHPRPTAPWAASRRPSAQNDRAPGSRSVAPDASVHGRFSVWFQCFNWSPCQGDVGYDFVCTCECRFTIIRSFWFNALHKLHGLNDFKLYTASSHIFISLHALTSLDGTSMVLIVIHSDAGFFCYNHSGPKWVKSGRFYLLRSMPSKLCISIDLLQEMHICWYVELP